MIELRTGVPGSGKTLSMVERLAALFKRWAIHPDEARPVFVLGIPDLAFPVAECPLVSVQINKAGSPSLVPDWDAMPDGSLVLIDEAQGVFPPRSSASVSPSHVAWLNTHRHHGFDIWLTTQHPKLIDGTVRALVGKHQHYRRLFGGVRAAVYEWDACSDSLSGLKSAVVSYWSYPKKVFKWYKSAEIHTKQSFKLPTWLMIPVVGAVMLAVFVPKAFSIVYGDGIKKTAPKAPEVVAAAPAPQSQNGAEVGALAPAVAPLRDFPVLGKAADNLKEKITRSISDIKLAYGVYTDIPEEPAHFTEKELQVQAQAVAVLDKHVLAGRYVIASATVREVLQEEHFEPETLPPLHHDPMEKYYGF